jgi:glycosyltransferase involved in cell wall biosynthesis
LWQGHPTGIQRVVSELGVAWTSLSPSVQVGKLSDKSKIQLLEPVSLESKGEAELKAGDWFFTAGSNWDYPDLQVRIETLKTSGVRIGTLFYDTIPIKYPYFFGPGLYPIYEAWLTQALGQSDAVFAISKNTLQDLCEFTDRQKIQISKKQTVVRLGDDLPALKVSDELTNKFRAKYNQPFTLCVGSIEYRKNHAVLLNAYRYLMGEKGLRLPKLYIVGRWGFMHNNVDYQLQWDLQLAGQIEVLNDVSDIELDYLYRNAEFTLYPSIYEGWGLPVAESLRYGQQCITSNSSSMKEIAPNLIRFAHPLKMEEWAKHIEELCLEPKTLEKEKQKIKATYKGTSWVDTAQILNRFFTEGQS